MFAFVIKEKKKNLTKGTILSSRIFLNKDSAWYRFINMEKQDRKQFEVKRVQIKTV